MRFTPETLLTQTHQTPGLDNLSRNDQERDLRFRAALHEAHHLMASVVYQSGHGPAYIPRPGTSIPRHEGASAAIYTNDPRTVPDAVIALMGPAAEQLIHGRADSPLSAGDRAYLESMRDRAIDPPWEIYPLTPQLELELWDRARSIALGYAAEIDLAACAMLGMSKKAGGKGEVSFGKMNKLYNWLTEEHKHERGGIRAALDKRHLYINMRGNVPVHGGVITHRDMKQHRAKLDRSTAIHPSDYERFGINNV